MTKTTTGWVILLASVGMMFGLLSVDLLTLKEWSEVTTPTFVGTTIGHIAAVIAAFVGGRIMPEPRAPGTQTRATDLQVKL